MSESLNRPEPAPQHNDRPAVWPLVIADMQERNETGIAKYGTPLQPFNGRDALVDAYQEALDQSVYLRQEIEERADVVGVLQVCQSVFGHLYGYLAHKHGADDLSLFAEMDNANQVVHDLLVKLGVYEETA